jgi:serine/threonine protein phosphatase PrpC
MPATAMVTAAAETHPGLQRSHNEDRLHVDPVRGIFAVIDGVGGQAAGEKAADTALAMLRARLERETGAIEDRVREAIAVAATEIHRQAGLRPEWRGMACVLTVAVLDDAGHLVIGHVGDTRLYKIHRGAFLKLTRDHSPVGEREDAGELSEQAAMSHPRRNEVYRDVGSEAHGANDEGFIDIIRAPFEPDAAILICSDGLTDYVPAATIVRTIQRHRGRPHDVARALVDEANDAGGNDNVSVVYVEGPAVQAAEASARAADQTTKPRTAPSRWLMWALVLAAWSAVVVAALAFRGPGVRSPFSIFGGTPKTEIRPQGPIIVRPGESISAALAAATPGSVVLVQAGEYRERLTLRTGVEVRSVTLRGAALRLPPSASESDPAVHAADITNAALVGFRIVGDAATPLGTAVLLQNADVTLQDLEISGASRAAIEFGAGSAGSLVAAHLHDNPGAALLLRERAAPRISHSVFARNGASTQSPGPFFIAPDASPRFSQNVFVGLTPAALATGAARAAIQKDNFFPRREP